jgi:polar amino acid transport system substrate-binding protein
LYRKGEYVYARKDNPRIKQILAIRSVDGLRPFKLVETIGSGWAEEHFKGIDIIWAPTYSTALNLLAKGRADIFVLGRERMLDIQQRIKQGAPNKEDLEKIIIGPEPLAYIDFSLLIRKDSEYAHIIPLFNRTLQQMKEDGSYQAIFNQYFNAEKGIPILK